MPAKEKPGRFKATVTGRDAVDQAIRMLTELPKDGIVFDRVILHGYALISATQAAERTAPDA